VAITTVNPAWIASRVASTALITDAFATVTLKDETANDIIYEEIFIEPTYDEK